MGSFSKSIISAAFFVIALTGVSGQAGISILSNPDRFYTPGVEGVFGDSHAGYGYVGSSEAETYELFRMSCTKAAQSRRFDALVLSGTSFDEARALGKLRGEVFEYLALRKAALSPNVRPVKLEVPACLTADSARFGALSGLPMAAPSDLMIKSADSGNALMLMKYRATISQLTPFSTISAAIFHRFLVDQQALVESHKRTERALEIHEQILRLESDFSLLFFPTPSSTELARAQQAFYPALDRWLKMGDDLSANFESVRGGEFAEFRALLVSKLNASIGPSAKADLKKSFQELMKAEVDIWRVYRAVIEEEMKKVCDLSLDDMLVRYRNAVSQALADSRGRLADLAELQSVLCTGSLTGLRVGPACEGVSGGPLPGAVPVKADQEVYAFPYSANSSLLFIQHAVGDSVTVQVSVPVLFDDDVVETERRAALELWNQTTSDWYNCYAGTLGKPQYQYLGGYVTPGALVDPALIVTQSCASSPLFFAGKSLRFEVHFDAINAAEAAARAELDGAIKTVRVHRCFRTEIDDETQARDCKAVRDFAVKDWQAGCSKGDQACLDKMVAWGGLVGSPTLNRADSGNFILGQRLKTVFHEVGHLMGLRDEYEDAAMPIGLLGPKESFMNNSHDDHSHPMAYHFARIAEPLSCTEE